MKHSIVRRARQDEFRQGVGRRRRRQTRLTPLALILLVCLPLLLPVGGADGQEATSPPLEHVTLQLRWKHQFQFAGYYAAQQQGFYRAAGLDVTIVEAQDGQDPIGTVVAGDAEYGVGNSELVVWRSRGEPVVVLGVIFQHSPLVLLTTRRSGIDSLHDLIGKRVAIEENSAELLAYLQDEGISVRRLITVSHSFDPQGLIDGTLDALSAYSTDEPFALQSTGVDYQIFSPRSAGIDFYGDVLFTTESEIQQHPQRVQAFLQASMQGWKYAFDHQAELVNYIYDQLTQRHSIEHLTFEAEEMRRLVLPDLIEPGYMYVGRWRAIVETYARVGLIPATFDVAPMLYAADENDAPDLVPLYTGIAVGLLLTALVGSVALRIYRLNQQLRRQIAVRVRAEAQLRESEARYRSLVEAAPFAVIITRLSDNTICYINPRAETQLKIRHDDAVGRPAVDFYVTPADRERFIEQMRASDRAQDFEVCLRDTRGSRFWASMSAIRMIFEQQPAIFVTFKDISERRWMEDKLRESEALYRSILHASPDAVAITDLTGSIELISPAGLRLLAAAPDDCVGHPIQDWALPEARSLFADHIASLLRGDNWGTEQYRMVGRDGVVFHVEINAEIIRDAANQPSRLVFIIRDITERKAAEAQAFALAVEQERVNVLAAFIRDASHEFRTPLTVIGSSLYLMVLSDEEAKRQRHAEKAELQIKQITRLVDMLMLMARLDSGTPPQHAAVDLRHLIYSAAAGMQAVFAAKQIRLHVETGSEPVIIQGDASDLDIALRHLLENAQRFTPAGGDVTLRLGISADAATVEVRDTGVGIRAEALPHIFERFWREDQAHSTPGFGLGLALARTIITTHRGMIQVESALGQGSVFRITFPLIHSSEFGIAPA